MNKPLFNDDTQPIKRPTRATFRIMIWLLVLFLLLVFGVMVSIITKQPEVIGLVAKQDIDKTHHAIDLTADSMQTTAQYHQDQSIYLQNTQAALNNWASRLSQTETQQAFNEMSTRNAQVLANAQQATQAAVDFASTQAALQLIGTQIQQDFEMTQAAISNSLATMEANRPIQQHIAYLNGNFRRGVETSVINQFQPSIAWGVGDSGMLISQVGNATVLTSQTDFGGNFTYYVGIKPLHVPAHYDVLIGILSDQRGYTLRIYHDGTQIIRAALFAIASNSLHTETPLIVDESAAMNIASNLAIAAEEIYVEIQVDAGRNLTAISNGVLLFSAPTEHLINGAVGVQIPAQTQLHMMQVGVR